MRAVLVFLFFVVIWFDLYAEGSWTYKQCAHYALRHNLKLKEVQYDRDKSEYRYKDALNEFIPSILGNTSYGINRGKTVDPNTNDVIENEFFSNTYQLRGSIDIFRGFSRYNRIQFEKYNLKAVDNQYEKEKNDLVFRVLEAFTQHILNEGLVDIQTKQMEMSEKELERVRELIELGRVPSGEQYEVEARVASDRFQLTRYQKLSGQSLLQLKNLMNYPADSSLKTQALFYDTLSFDTLSKDTLYNRSKGSLPRILDLTNQLEASKKQVKMIKADLYPSLSIYSGWQTGYYETSIDEAGNIIGFDNQFSQNRRLNYGISLYIPISGFFQRHNDIKQARVDKKQMENRLSIQLNQLEYDIHEAIMSWEAALSEYQMARKKVKSREVAFHTAKNKWEEGLISIMDFYESRNRLAEAKGESLRTRLQLFMQERTIQFYLKGTLLESL